MELRRTRHICLRAAANDETRPYEVGDFVSAGDVVGTVTATRLFVTTLDTQTHVGNNKILSGIKV